MMLGKSYAPAYLRLSLLYTKNHAKELDNTVRSERHNSPNCRLSDHNDNEHHHYPVALNPLHATAHTLWSERIQHSRSIEWWQRQHIKHEKA